MRTTARRRHAFTVLSKVRETIPRLKAIEEELYRLALREIGDVIDPHDVDRDDEERVTFIEESVEISEKDKRDFCRVTVTDLENVGVIPKRWLDFNRPLLKDAIETLPQAIKIEINGLRDRLLEFHERIHMPVGLEPSSGVCIIEAVLVTLARITSGKHTHTEVAILPQPSPTYLGEDGYTISNSRTGHELCLTGNFDYVVMEYQDNHKDALFSEVILADEAFKFYSTRKSFLVVKAKHSRIHGGISADMYEATMQARVMADCYGVNEVRFCLSNGKHWYFCILQKDNDRWVSYESVKLELDLDALRDSDKALSEIVVLAMEWLFPSIEDLYRLENY